MSGGVDIDNVFYFNGKQLSKVKNKKTTIFRKKKVKPLHFDFANFEKNCEDSLIFNHKISQTKFLVNENMDYPFNYNNLLYLSRLHFYFSRAVAYERDYYRMLEIADIRELKAYFKKCKKRKEWNSGSFRLRVMKRACELQLIQNYELRMKLLAISGKEKIVYFNVKDKFFGVGSDFKGSNHLGKIFTECRNKYLREYNKNMKAYNYKKDVSLMLEDVSKFLDKNKARLSEDIRKLYFKDKNDEIASFDEMFKASL